MIILAIETSCDDTCVAVVKMPGFDILSNIVSSQVEIHKKWGGVYPALAKREHQKNLPVILEKVLKKAKKPKIDLIAVTVGPGLEPCLWTGVNFAKKLAKKWNLPIVSVNHIKAHIFVNEFNKKPLIKKDFPVVCLIVSGGHTQLFLMEDFGKYKILGETRDDAAGECLDKTARILGLGYPGGPAIAAAAAKLPTTNYKLQTKLPRPMIRQKNYDFSFSGLKTAVLYTWEKISRKDLPRDERQRILREMAKEIQQSIIDVLIKKTIKAAKDYRAKTILVGGGVAANKQLRKQLTKICKSKLKNCKIFIPPKELCTDNAVMTALAGYFRWKQGKTEKHQKIQADANLKIC